MSNHCVCHIISCFARWIFLDTFSAVPYLSLENSNLSLERLENNNKGPGARAGHFPSFFFLVLRLRMASFLYPE